MTPLIYASEKGHLEIVKELLAQPGIDINCKSILNLKYSSNYNLAFFIQFQITFYLWN